MPNGNDIRRQVARQMQNNAPTRPQTQPRPTAQPMGGGIRDARLMMNVPEGGGGGGGTTNHAALSNLGFDQSGHTGFSRAVHTHTAAQITDLVVPTPRDFTASPITEPEISANAVTDSKIGFRAVLDQAADGTLAPINNKYITTWLQALRNNMKFAFEEVGRLDDLEAEIDRRDVVSLEVNIDQTEIIVTYADNTQEHIDISKAEISLDYDPDTKELIFIDPQGNEQRIPLGDLVPVIEGSDGEHINVDTTNNVISAQLKAGTITETELSEELIEFIEAQAFDDSAVNDELARLETDKTTETWVQGNAITKGVAGTYVQIAPDATPANEFEFNTLAEIRDKISNKIFTASVTVNINYPSEGALWLSNVFMYEGSAPRLTVNIRATVSSAIVLNNIKTYYTTGVTPTSIIQFYVPFEGLLHFINAPYNIRVDAGAVVDGHVRIANQLRLTDSVINTTTLGMRASSLQVSPGSVLTLGAPLSVDGTIQIYGTLNLADNGALTYGGALNVSGFVIDHRTNRPLETFARKEALTGFASEEWVDDNFVNKDPMVMSPADGSVLDYADAQPRGITPFVNSGTTATDTPLPTSGFKYVLYKHTSILGTLMAFTTPASGSTSRAFFNSRNNAGWIGWQEIATQEWALNRDPVLLEDDTDLNDIHAPGNYRSINDANAATILNLPMVPITGFNLQVLKYGNLDSQVFQMLHTTSNYGRYFFRYASSSGEWRNWVSMTSSALRLPQGTDFNAVNNGNWYVNNAADAQTMLNIPINNTGGILEVIALDASDTSARKQRFTTFNISAIYERGYSGSPLAWSAWRRIDRANYSVAEHTTGALWIDGKPIYRRAFTGHITGAANTVVSTQLISAGHGFDTLVSSGGYIQMGGTSGSKLSINSATVQGVFPQVETANTVYTQGNDVYLQSCSNAARTGTTNNAYSCWVEYTKP